MKLVDIDVELVHQTEKAYLVKFDEDKDPVWVPKSAAELDGRQLTLPENMAIEKGMV